jgi:hypothetical protein
LNPYSLKDLIRDARDPLFVGVLCWGFLSVLGVLWPTAWAIPFAILLSYVLFDIVLNLFVRGRTIPVKGHLFQPTGWIFASFIVGIVIGTVTSSLFSEWIGNVIADDPLGRLWTVIASLILVPLLYWDFATKASWIP